MRRRLAVVAGAAVALVMAGYSLTSLPSSDAFATLDYLTATAAALTLALSGVVLVWRLPSHPVGWLLWGSGTLLAVAIGAQGLATVVRADDPGTAGWIVLVGASAWVPSIVCLALLLPLVFPTGRLPSPRWRLVVAVGIVSATFNIAQNVLTPFDPANSPAGLSNPVGADGLAPDLGNLLGALSSAAGVICLPLVAASLLQRYRHATGVERAQLKWLASVIGVAGPSLAFGILIQRVPGELAIVASNLGFLVAFLGFGLLPVAIGVAILRYRLYEIDVIIRRTVVYVPLTAILAGLYAASTALFQRLFIAATGERSDAAVVASTLILATLFTPIKSSLQAIVDRRFRDQVDARRRLEAYVNRIGSAEWRPDPARTLRGFLTVAIEALDTPGGRALLADGDDLRPVAVVGTMGEPGAIADVESAGRRLGRIELAPRARGRPYRTGETARFVEAAHDLADAMSDTAWVAPRPSPDGHRPAPAEPEAELQAESAAG